LPNPPPPPLTTDQQTALAALNVAQRELDRQQRILSSMQWTLFGLWWMSQWLQSPLDSVPDPAPSDWLRAQLPLQIGSGSTPNDPNGTDPAQEAWYAWKVNAQQNLVAQLTTNVTTATTTLTDRLDSTLSTKATNAPQFYAPQDPVVMITGLGRATNFDPSDGILCRLPSQTVTSLTVGGRAYSAGSVAAQVPVLADPNGVLPDGIQALNVENLFLSPSLFAQAVLGSTSPATVTAVSTASGGNWPPADGQFPPLAVAAQLWSQPWVPLLLEWQVTVLNAPGYMYSVTQQDRYNIDTESIWRHVPANWQFAGADPNQPDAQGIDFSGSGRPRPSPRIRTTRPSTRRRTWTKRPR
jgi:hypothetical protein